MPTVTNAELPLYRLDVETYEHMVVSGALEGMDGLDSLDIAALLADVT